MSSKPELRLAYCSHAAAKYAVSKWHYSRSLPPPPHIRVGVWEGGKFIGCVLFARGASSHLLKPYGLEMTEGCELVRVALSQHVAPVTKIVSIAIRLLLKRCPGLRLIVSFADPDQGHAGGIYQAGNWVYAGQSVASPMYVGPDGRRWHNRMVSHTGTRKVYGKLRKVVRKDQCTKIVTPGKHRYLMPLDDAMRQQIEALRKPYPKRAGSDTKDTPAIHAGEGGSSPTPALQITRG